MNKKLAQKTGWKTSVTNLSWEQNTTVGICSQQDISKTKQNLPTNTQLPNINLKQDQSVGMLSSNANNASKTFYLESCSPTRSTHQTELKPRQISVHPYSKIFRLPAQSEGCNTLASRSDEFLNTNGSEAKTQEITMHTEHRMFTSITQKQELLLVQREILLAVTEMQKTLAFQGNDTKCFHEHNSLLMKNLADSMEWMATSMTELVTINLRQLQIEEQKLLLNKTHVTTLEIVKTAGANNDFK